MKSDIGYLIDIEIKNRIKNRSRLFNLLMDNEIPKVGEVIINSMNEDMAVILALKRIVKVSDNPNYPEQKNERL